MVFGSSDLHDGTRVDIPSILSHLAQEVVIMGNKGNGSPYPKVFQSKGIQIYERLSNAIYGYKSHSQKLTELEVAENRDFYISGTMVGNVA